MSCMGLWCAFGCHGDEMETPETRRILQPRIHKQQSATSTRTRAATSSSDNAIPPFFARLAWWPFMVYFGLFSSLCVAFFGIIAGLYVRASLSVLFSLACQRDFGTSWTILVGPETMKTPLGKGLQFFFGCFVVGVGKNHGMLPNPKTAATMLARNQEQEGPSTLIFRILPTAIMTATASWRKCQPQ